MTSQRDFTTDKAWNYVRPLAKSKPYLLFDEITTGIYEVVVRDGLSTKTMSNSDDPPNSFRTRDTFVKHPTLPDAWKYLGRLDDRVTLFNGEKVLPVPYEHAVRQSELVGECLVFGVGRAFPGLLVFPSRQAAETGKSADELLDLLWPVIREANERAEKFSRVSKEMVRVMPPGTEYPATDKGTVIRAACYARFQDVIEDVYQKFETPDNAEGRLALGIPELQEYLLKLLSERVGVSGLAADTDFFAAGMDSLQAITGRAHILRELDLGGKTAGQNVVFDYPSVDQLATYLHSLRTGLELHEQTEEEIMQELVAKYSTFPPFKGGDLVPDAEVVILTGATGSLGAHILSQLLSLPHVRHVYCLVRAASPSAAHARVLASLTSRGLTPHPKNPSHDRVSAALSAQDPSFPPHHSAKFTALPSDLSQQDLGLGPEVYDALRTTVTSIIHSAWAVNFTLTVRSFETQHIAGLRHLLDLALSVPFPRPACLSFVSSVSAAAGTPPPARVAEALAADPRHAQGMGYARSKWVAEHVVAAAARSTGMEARALRSGQIIGDSALGRWNPTEAIPLMVRAAETIGALPALDETPSWLPVDRSARAVLELSGLAEGGGRTEGYFQVRDREDVVYHVQNPVMVRWTEDVLPALADAGLRFEIVGQREWVQRLREGDQDPIRNPTVKLLDFFASKYDNDKPGRSGLIFETGLTERRSRTIGEGYDIIKSGLLAKCVESWRKDWA
jgi:thioester reductase-like protein